VKAVIAWWKLARWAKLLLVICRQDQRYKVIPPN
jgi:hypothetical protein